MLAQMSVRPWRNGWLEYLIPGGLMRWWSSYSITVESIRILGGMTVVTYRASNTSKTSVLLPPQYPLLSSGYRHASDSLLSVFWLLERVLQISSYKLVTHSCATLDDTTVAASPTLQALRRECRLKIGKSE